MRYIEFGNTKAWEHISNKKYDDNANIARPVLKNNCIYKASSFSNIHISSQTICGVMSISCTFTRVKFSHSSIECSNFFESTFIDCTFEECLLFHADFEHTTWTDCKFLSTRLPYSRFLHAIFNNTEFEDCDIYHVLFSNKTKEGIRFSICNEEEAYFDISI